MSKSTKLDVDKELAKLDELRKLRNISLDELFTLIEYLKVNYDPERSLKVIACLSARMESDDYVPPELLQALIKHAFALIMEGKNADQAFGLAPIRGRYARPNNESRNMQITALVILTLRKQIYWKDANGKIIDLILQFIDWEDAVGQVSDYMELGERTVSRAYGEYGSFFSSLENKLLKGYLSDDDIAQLSFKEPPYDDIVT